MRYVRLFQTQLRMSALLALQYRYDFFVDGAINLFWAFAALAPLFIVYQGRTEVAGWSFPEALLVIGWFTLLESIVEGSINPSLTTVVEHIRKGTLDFVLLKPADAQFLVSTSRFEPWRSTNVLAALAIFTYAFHLMGRSPGVGGVMAALLLLGSAIVLLYSLWIITVSAAFYFVKMDNLQYLFTSVFDAARWPSSVFRGTLRFVFTFIVPLALMTTFPAEAMLGRRSGAGLLVPVACAAVFTALARLIWQRSISRYTSASS
jgi:ABC-2 type transport system permease protein